MSISHQFYKEEGRNRAKVDAPFEYMGGFLQSNIISEYSINKIFDMIAQLQNGDIEGGA